MFNLAGRGLLLILDFMPDAAAYSPHYGKEPALNVGDLGALSLTPVPQMLTEFAAIIGGKTDFSQVHKLISESPASQVVEALQTLIAGRAESDAHYQFFGALFKALLNASSLKEGEDRLHLLVAIESAAKTCRYPFYEAHAALAQGRLFLSRGDLEAARRTFERAEQILRKEKHPPPELTSARIPALNLLMGLAREKGDFCRYARLTREATALAQRARLEEFSIEDLDRLSALLSTVLKAVQEKKRPHRRVASLAALLQGKVLAERLGRVSPEERAAWLTGLMSTQS